MRVEREPKRSEIEKSAQLLFRREVFNVEQLLAFAVVGASTDRAKFGNKVLRWYQEHGLSVTPVHRTESQIEGVQAVKSLDELPDSPQRSVSIITPAKVTLGLLQDAAKRRDDWRYWLQPGAEDDAVRRFVDATPALRDRVTLGGPCILVLGQSLLESQRAGKL